jgi:hypothetical protein
VFSHQRYVLEYICYHSCYSFGSFISFHGVSISAVSKSNTSVGAWRIERAAAGLQRSAWMYDRTVGTVSTLGIPVDPPCLHLRGT